MPGPRSMIRSSTRSVRAARRRCGPERPAGCTARRSRPGWRPPAPAGRGRPVRPAASVGTSRSSRSPREVIATPGSSTSSRPTGARLTDSAPACSRDRSSRLVTSAVSRSRAWSAPASSSCRSARRHWISVLRRLETAALAAAIGVRRSWLTALSSAVRARSVCGQFAGRAGRARSVAAAGRRPRPRWRRRPASADPRPPGSVPAAPAPGRHRSAPRCRRPPAGRTGRRPTAASVVHRRHAGCVGAVRGPARSSAHAGHRERLRTRCMQRRQRLLAPQQAAGQGGQRLGLGVGPGGLDIAAGGLVDHPRHQGRDEHEHHQGQDVLGVGDGQGVQRARRSSSSAARWRPPRRPAPARSRRPGCR